MSVLGLVFFDAVQIISFAESIHIAVGALP